ncbi:DUF1876 domain-containing protein [Pseudonocardia ailaonensis]|uniref:DUF1876 domain-containing protein n=1 Tax=Pseudonocardia ailaonensis TaxID=367279 RepID=A0ABN2NPJ7_9PSEU
MRTVRWNVVVDIEEVNGESCATARLHDRSPDHLFGIGRSWIGPQDRDLPEIGDEMAAARALNDLSNRLIGRAYAEAERAPQQQPTT